MKKLIIIIAIIVLVLGVGLAAVYFTTNNSENDAEEDTSGSIAEVGDTHYYDAQYQGENTATKLRHLTYSVPDGFIAVNSEDDSRTENCFLNEKTGLKLSITEKHGDSLKHYEALSKEYLDGVDNVEKFSIGDYTGYKYTYNVDGEIVECDFHIIADDTLYTATLYDAVLDGEPDDDYVPDPISEESQDAFDKLCKSFKIDK